MRISLVILSLVTAYVLGKQEIYPCFTDLCNVDTEPQFCSSTFKLCRDCKEIIQECYTPKQPRNCSQYCEANLCTDVDRMLTISNGNATAQQYNGRSMIVGSEIIYGCNAGYKIDGSTKITCLGNNTWSEKSVSVCFHRSQLDMAINQAFESKKMEEETTCFVTQTMTYLANGEVIAPENNDSRVPVGTTFRHICNNGYSLEGPVTQNCLGNDTWSEIETPYCLDNTWKRYKRATIIGYGIICTCCFLAAILLAIKLCRHSRKEKESELSRHSTDASLPEELELFISKSDDQTFHTEHEQRSPKREKLIESPPATSTALPSAPPEVEEPQNENKMGQQNDINNRAVNNQTGLQCIIHVINNVNGNNPPEACGRSAEKKPREGATSANQTHQRNRKGIDIKMSTEESNTTDVTEEFDEADITEETDATEAVKETVSDVKSRGTKPLPARGQKAAGAQEEMSKGNDATGPQAVTAKDESIQSPTKETGQDRPPGKLGFDHATFPSTDAERSEIQADVAEYPNEVGSTQRLDELKEGIGTNVQTTA